MKKLLPVALLLAVACASQDSAPEPVTVPQAAPDPRVDQLQTQLTELLERLDVMNSRLARLEEQGPAAASAPSSAATAEEPVPNVVPQNVRRTETAAAPTEAAPPVQPQRALVGAQLAEDYRQAIMLFGRGRHAEARRGFEKVLESDAAGDLADNALFWIGETYFAARDYTNAMRYYNRVVTEFADQNKAPDALFKIALAYEKTGDLALARKTLQQVVDQYPYSSTASSAKAEMQRIRY